MPPLQLFLYVQIPSRHRWSHQPWAWTCRRTWKTANVHQCSILKLGFRGSNQWDFLTSDDGNGSLDTGKWDWKNYRLKKGIVTHHLLNPELLTTDACARTIVHVKCNVLLLAFILFLTPISVSLRWAYEKANLRLRNEQQCYLNLDFI